jgi:hypothetical protein
MSNSSSCTTFEASTLICYDSITAGSTALAAVRSFDSWLSSSSTGYYIRLYGYFYAICIVASLWVFYVARRLQPGLQRALVCLPIVVLQLAATPVLVDRHRTAVLIVPVCGILSLAAFKVRTAAGGGSKQRSSRTICHMAEHAPGMSTPRAAHA